jgi:Trypsin-like peptidase domain
MRTESREDERVPRRARPRRMATGARGRREHGPSVMHDRRWAANGVLVGKIASAAALLLLVSVAWAAGGTLTGTGFAVDHDGTLVTNEHVISRCVTITVHQGAQRVAATVRARDHANDLALIKLAQPTEAAATIRRGPVVRLGEQIVAYGFPLVGALATEGNLTVGYVSALRGLGNDEKTIQITAPVQRGNSGGPLVDLGGNVIGVVSSKLDTVKIMNAFGDVPQNVNFAIALDRLTEFLQTNHVQVIESDSFTELRLPDIADRVRGFTYLIECQSPSVAAGTPQGPPSSLAATERAPTLQAECAKETSATRQLLAMGRSAIQAAAQSPEPVKCQALRRYYSAMVTAREVFARCDLGELRTEHAAQLESSISKFKTSMPPDCPPDGRRGTRSSDSNVATAPAP